MGILGEITAVTENGKEVTGECILEYEDVIYANANGKLIVHVVTFILLKDKESNTHSIRPKDIRKITNDLPF